MTLKKGQQLELDISDIAIGGMGFTKYDDFAVFIKGVVPQDRVLAQIIKKKKNYAEARLIELLSPSPLRIHPPCVYSGFCGGCAWQFLNYDSQLDYKRRHLVQSLEHIALIHGVLVHPTIRSEKIFGYRNKMEFSCADKTWLMPDDMAQGVVDSGFALGLHVPGTFHKVLDMQACLLQSELGNRSLNDVREFMKNSGLPPYGLRSHVGFWRFLMLRHSAAYDQWMVNIITASEDRGAVQPLADMLTEKYPEIVSVVNNITDRKSGVAVGEYEILLTGSSVITDKIGKFRFEISANSFFQTNTAGAARLYEIVRQYAGLSGTERVLDLYCGTGTIAISLSDMAKEVIGIEIIDSAVADARQNCQLNQISNCRFVLGDIREVLPQIGQSPDMMIIDPPRVGMHKDVVKQVLEMKPSRIVYVSCNPATLARDLALLKEGYEVAEVQPVDMFPHTFHIESVARLEYRK